MYNEFISFLKSYNLYNKEIVKNFFKTAFMYDYINDEDIIFNMCIYVINNDNVLIDLKPCVPYINNYKTMLINIHEYVHYYIMYKKLGKKIVIGRNCELLPMLYEKIFIMEKNDKELNDYDEELTNIIKREKNPDYIYALENREKLLNLFCKKKILKKNS